LISLGQSQTTAKKIEFINHCHFDSYQSNIIRRLRPKSTMANLSAQLYKHLNHNEFDQFVDLINQNPGCVDQLNSIILNNTLLNIAIMFAKMNYVRVLVQNGARMDNKSELDGFDALFEAVNQCAKSCSHFSDRDSDNRKARAMSNIEEYNKIIVFLLESGADANTVDRDGDSLLVLLCWHRYHDNKIKQIIKNIVTVLLDYNMNINMETVYCGHTIGYYCMANNNGDLLDHIMNYQPEVITKGCHCDGDDM